MFVQETRFELYANAYDALLILEYKLLTIAILTFRSLSVRENAREMFVTQEAIGKS